VSTNEQQFRHVHLVGAILLQFGAPAKPAASVWGVSHYFVMMILHINGRQREFTAETMSVADLVLQLGLQGKRFAMERNGEIVPRGSFENVMLASGDKLEIVGAVGGG
jgi:sulfur carrier protein